MRGSGRAVTLVALLAVAVFAVQLGGTASAAILGPDSFGYVADTSAVAFYQDISTTGTPILVNNDDTTSTIPIGFGFPFYANTYGTVFVSSNGLLTFNSGNSSFTNANLTAAGGPAQPAIAPLWDDWETRCDIGSADDAVWYQTDTFPQRLTVQWRVYTFNSPGPGLGGCVSAANRQDFEAVLFADGTIEFRYFDVTTGFGTSSGGSATVGIRDAAPPAPGDGRVLQASFNTPSIAAGQTIRYSIPAGGGGGGAPTLSVVKVGTGTGNVKSTPPGINCPPDCTEPFAPDTVVRLTATPGTGSSFRAWGGSCNGTGACQLVMSTGVNQIVSAWFDPSTSPPPGSDLSVTGTASADPRVGSPLTYTFTMANAGPDAATGVKLEGTLPANVVPSATTAAATGCTITGSDFTCAIGDLANGASAEVTFSATPYRSGTFTAAATVSSSGTDPNAANDSASVAAEVALVCTISGTPGDDSLSGTEGIDVICAKAGDDTVSAAGGNDVVMGGPGSDSLGGGEGDDLLKGGRNDDALDGGPGTDTCEGGGGENTFLACES